MKLGYELTLEQQQKLVMTPELLQAIQILQFNSFELDSYVNEQLISNPVLETSGNDAPKETISREDAISQFVGEYGGYSKGEGSSYQGDDEEGNYENYVTTKTSLTDYLLFQLQFVCVNKEETEVGEYIVQSLDENGYLTMSTEDIAEKLNVDSKLVERVLYKVQQFEPAGIAARDLKDCLIRQLEMNDSLDKEIEAVINNYLEELASNKLGDIAKGLNISCSRVQEIVDIIRGLDPKPGCGLSSNRETMYVTPDIFVEKNQEGEYEVKLNETTIPGLKVSSYYEKLLKDNKSDEIVKIYLTEKMESAIWLIKSIQQRKDTILNVAKALVEHQMDFFKNGEKYLKPMTLKQIADQLEIHESTVSRTVNGKYLQCCRGVYELKYFFSAGIASEDGEDISSTGIKSYLKEIISKEDSKSPYSDQKLVDMLKKEGFSISRRTVAKYRDEMGIASSSKRKRY